MAVIDSCHPKHGKLVLEHHNPAMACLYDVEWRVVRSWLSWSPLSVTASTKAIQTYLAKDDQDPLRLYRVGSYLATRKHPSVLDPLLDGGLAPNWEQDWDWNDVRTNLVSLGRSSLQLLKYLRDVEESPISPEGHYYSVILSQVVAQFDTVKQWSRTFVPEGAGAYCGHCGKWFPEDHVVYGTPASTPLACPDHFCLDCAEGLQISECDPVIGSGA